MCKKHSRAKEKSGAYEQHYLSFVSMEMFQIAVLMTNSSFSDCCGTLLRLLGMNQTSCSYDSFTAPWKPAEKKVGITVDTKLNVIQKCSLITNKATSMLNYIMKTMTTRPFIPLYSMAIDPNLDYCDQFWAPQLEKIVTSKRGWERCTYLIWRCQGQRAVQEKTRALEGKLQRWLSLTLFRGAENEVKGEMVKLTCPRGSN